MEKLILIGMALILIGIITVIIGSIWTALSGKSEVDVGVGGFIGPIPFGFFTSKKAFWIWLLVAAIVIVAWLLIKKL